jgi:hypothetical protein
VDTGCSPGVVSADVAVGAVVVVVRHGGLAVAVWQCVIVSADVAVGAVVVVVRHGGLAAVVWQGAAGADVGAVVALALCVLVDATVAAVGQGRKLPLSLPFEPLPWLSSQFPCPPPLCTHGSPPWPGGHSGATSVSPRRSFPPLVFVGGVDGGAPDEVGAGVDGGPPCGFPAAATAANAPAAMITAPSTIVARPLLASPPHRRSRRSVPRALAVSLRAVSAVQSTACLLSSWSHTELSVR